MVSTETGAATQMTAASVTSPANNRLMPGLSCLDPHGLGARWFVGRAECSATRRRFGAPKAGYTRPTLATLAQIG